MTLFGDIASDRDVFLGGTVSGRWRFSTTVTMADPSSGNFRYNNATIGSVTAIAISDNDRDGTDLSNILSALGNGDRLYVQVANDASQFAVWNVTSTVDNTTWWQINVTSVALGTLPANNAACNVAVVFA